MTPATEPAPITPPVAPPAAPAAPPVAPPAAPPPADPKVETTITFAELRSLLEKNAELEQLRAAEAQKAREAEERAIKNAMEKGEFSKALERMQAMEAENKARLAREKEEAVAAERSRANAERERLAAEKAATDNARKSVEARARRYAIDGELGKALAPYAMVDGAADDAISLIRPHLQADDHGESFAVRSADGRSVADVVAAFFNARPHLLKATSGRGGTINGPGSAGISPGHAPVPEAPPQPKNFGEAAIMQQLHNIKNQKGGVDPMMNMSLPIGLKAAR